MNRKVLPIAGLVTGLVCSSFAWSADGSRQGPIADAWIGGKIEGAYALNPHLNPFKIDTDVKGGVVTLSGVVESDIDRDLAAEIAKGVEGVNDVDNDLEVSAKPARKSAGADTETFGQWVSDATTTATVKMKLVANGNVAARHIDVDTKNGVVTLRGQVSSGEEKDLAMQLAQNAQGVSKVTSQLTVSR